MVVIEDTVGSVVMIGGVVSVDSMALLAVQEAGVPVPSQLQADEDVFVGFVGEEGFAVPDVQYAPAGNDSSAV